METTQQAVIAPPPPTRGLFGSGIPSSVAFALGILLFLLPFAEIKCGGSVIANKSGLDVVMAKQWKKAGGAGLFGENDLKQKSMTADKEDKGNSQLFGLAALALGVLGLLLSVAGAKAGGAGGMITGVLSAGAMIGLMLDMKKTFNSAMTNQALDKTKETTDNFGFDKIGNSMNNIKPVINFTPWFYVVIVAFLAAAFFCYQRMQAAKK